MRKKLPLYLLILFGIICLFFVIRLINLTIIPVFADEAIYIRWSQIMAYESTLRFLPLSDGKQPLYMWILMFIIKRASDPLFIGRLVSICAGAATLLGVTTGSYLITKSLKASLVSAVLYTVSPFSVFFDRMALVDSLLSAFIIWTWALGILTAKTLRMDTAMLTGFALGGALLTKSPGIFAAILIPTVFLLTKRSLKNYLKAFGLLSICYVIAFGMYNILRLGPNFNMISSRNYDYVFPFSHLWENPRDPFIAHIDRAIEWYSALLPIGVLILAIVAVAVALKNRKKELLLLALWILLPLLVQSEFAKVFTARYILFTVPFITILSSMAVIFKPAHKVGYLLVIVILIHSMFINSKLLFTPEAAPLPRSERSGYLEEWTAGTGIKEISEYLKKEHLSNPGKQIVVGTEGYFGTLPDGLQMYMQSVPNVIVIGVGLDLNDVPQSLKDAKKAGNKTYLVINDSRFKYDGELSDIGLVKIASYQKAKRPNFVREYQLYGEREHLLFFEVTQ